MTAKPLRYQVHATQATATHGLEDTDCRKHNILANEDDVNEFWKCMQTHIQTTMHIRKTRSTNYKTRSKQQARRMLKSYNSNQEEPTDLLAQLDPNQATTADQCNLKNPNQDFMKLGL